MNQNKTTQDIYRKIDRENAIINAANHIRQSTENASVNSRVDSQIRDARRNIQYFEKTLEDLQIQTIERGLSTASLSGTGAVAQTRLHGRSSSSMSRDLVQEQDQLDRGHSGHEGYGVGEEPLNLLLSAPSAASEPGGESKRAPPSYSQLDLIKYNTPQLGPRIQTMLSQLAFKLSVEKQYKDGVEKMVKLYEMEGSDKSWDEAELRRIESNQKMQLLKRALRKYEDLHIQVESDGDAVDTSHTNTLNQRQPLTGHLSIRIHEIAEVEHLVPLHSARPSTFVIMKIDSGLKSRTKSTKNDHWTNEQHGFDVDKGNELEFIVYGDSSGDHPIPIGFLWVRLSDLVDEIRRKKVETEFNQAGWTTADRMRGSQHRTNAVVGQGHHTWNDARGTTATGAGELPSSSPATQIGPVFVDEWFSLEPFGRIHLTVGFTKKAKDDHGTFDGVLNRKGAVRQKKQTVVEHYGHKFAKKTFYNIVRCALCGDLLKYTAGVQCTDCRYTCHQKCHQKVFIKCLSKLDSEACPDEETLNHQIPHRFDEFANIGANWCCHCGYMLPISKTGSRKCIECKLTCHTSCMHLVPNLCGMSMKHANEILKELKRTKTSRILRDGQHLQPPSHATDSGPQSLRQDTSVVLTANHKDPNPDNDSNRPHSAFLSGEERLQVLKEETRLTSSFDPVNAQSPDRTSYETTTAVQKTLPVSNEVNTGGLSLRSRIGLDYFDFIAVLGKGNFGKVMLAETKTTKQLYAIKVMKKHFIIENDEVEAAFSEKKIFLVANKERHPFLYTLQACFQTETRIYFVMEYVSGGDLMMHIQNGPFTAESAQFYAAEVYLALKYLHENGIIYRDLKLDNILLAADGHIKLADYGLCKENMWFGSTTRTFCGTTEFMAPEILLDKDYSTAVDWWAYGVVIYQMLLQQSPFRGEDEDEIYDAILADEPLYPVHMPRDTVSILQGLLTRQPEQRLGSGPTGAVEVMSHPFFRNINWEDLYHKRVPVPFVPILKGRTDVSNFDPEFTSMEPALTPIQTVLSPKMQEEFRGFSWSADVV